MAEFVQLRKEKWAEPLSMLVKLELLKPQEFRSVLFNLDNFENKIQSQHRKLEDILAYIQFECNLLQQIQLRRKERKQFDLSEEIDRFIYNEIRAQFGSAEINFTHSIDFWDAQLRFIANIVPDQSKEYEFNRLFKKALNYCGRANLNIYRSCVDYLWTFANKPLLTVHPKKRKRLSYRRDVSKLMGNVRYFTQEAIRNFPKSPEASIFLLTTELKYLQLLREEEELYNENPKVSMPFDIQEEAEKSEKLIYVIYRDLVSKNSETPSVYIQLYEAIRLLPLSEARQLSKKIYAQVISMPDRKPEVFAWLIGKSIDDNKIDEFTERINQALSSSGSKLKMLEICIEKLSCFLEKLELTRDPENCLPKLLKCYTKLVHKDNKEWNQVPSEVLHASRINLIKKLPQLMDKLPQEYDNEFTASIQSFQQDHDIEDVVKHFVKQFPSSYVLVKERIIQLLSQQDEDKVKPNLICKYLKEVNWKSCEDEKERLKLIQFIYYSFLTLRRLCKDKKLNDFLKIPRVRIPEMTEIRLMHLKKMYIEDIEHGRAFYQSFRFLDADWRFACQAVIIETTACRNTTEKPSDTLICAQQDAVRLAGSSSSTEPWKILIRSYLELKKMQEASHLLERSLKTFSGKEKTAQYEDMMLFSKKISFN